MDAAAAERLIRAGKSTLTDVMSATPLDQLDAVLERLKRRVPPQALCDALSARIAKAPLDDFESLKHLYFKHCPT